MEADTKTPLRRGAQSTKMFFSTQAVFPSLTLNTEFSAKLCKIQRLLNMNNYLRLLLFSFLASHAVFAGSKVRLNFRSVRLSGQALPMPTAVVLMWICFSLIYPKEQVQLAWHFSNYSRSYRSGTTRQIPYGTRPVGP